MMKGSPWVCIADDLAGAADLASNLAPPEMRVAMTVDLLGLDYAIDADAVVVA
jgi:hypothetical protein